jgi:hypothetical protein
MDRRDEIKRDLAILNRKLERDRRIADAIDIRYAAEPISSRGMIALAVDLGGEGLDADSALDLGRPDRFDLE